MALYRQSVTPFKTTAIRGGPFLQAGMLMVFIVLADFSRLKSRLFQKPGVGSAVRCVLSCCAFAAALIQPAMLLSEELPSGHVTAASEVAGGTLSSAVAPTDSAPEHSHRPIFMRSRPVVERLPVSVIDPIDLQVSASGYVFVADRKAQVVFRISKDGRTDLAAIDQQGLIRILISHDDTLCVLTRSDNSGRISQITPEGRAVEQHYFDFPPGGFAMDALGGFVVSSRQSGKLVTADASGEQRLLTTLDEIPIDLAMTTAEQTHALLPSGRVIFVGLDGAIETVGYAGKHAERLLQMTDGRLCTLHGSTDSRPTIRELSRTRDLPGVTVAQVPSGTVAVGFDSLGNLAMANPELRAVTRVTSRFMIPCPHCGQSVPLIFSTEPPDVKQNNSVRTF